jgi:hypothetical protein
MSTLATMFNVVAFPFIILFRGDKEIDRIESISPGDKASNNNILGTTLGCSISISILG